MKTSYQPILDRKVRRLLAEGAKPDEVYDYFDVWFEKAGYDRQQAQDFMQGIKQE
ncbi:hypothetical protein [Jeotgalibacillus campisalis]|uniref:Uncharacterized protein n=1 Tax=Jeotgalibacillus campisalis TaxID=220754 RepID=A0A0C2R7F5_9BACL|nr:hypothetical protein [Jeotgalibacillus campisalis]KIL46190.1 hypothetical protein KR50_28650 [Jeotgalibacillus campisalis]